MRPELRFLLAAVVLGFCVRVATRIAGIDGVEAELIGLGALAVFVVSALLALDGRGSGSSRPR